VAVLRGGPGGEREISLLSGQCVLDAVRESRHPALDVVIDAHGGWSIDGGPALSLLEALARLSRVADVVFPVLHGPFGEDGVLQGALQSAGLRYVGCGVADSAVAMDKVLARRIAASCGLAISRGVEGGPDRSDSEVARVARESSALRFPLFVKPACSGSSVGVTRVVEAKELELAIRVALDEGGRVIVEEAAEGTEVSCPVVGDAGFAPRALPVIAIVPKGHAFFDYEAKYVAGHSDEICPAPLPADLAARLQAAAIAMHEALGCRGVSRSDFIVTADRDFVFLETNTMPGLSRLSLVPKSLAAAGIPFAEQCARWIDSALATSRRFA
jgi:D-alanine-D-alanine ligase